MHQKTSKTSSVSIREHESFLGLRFSRTLVVCTRDEERQHPPPTYKSLQDFLCVCFLPFDHIFSLHNPLALLLFKTRWSEPHGKSSPPGWRWCERNCKTRWFKVLDGHKFGIVYYVPKRVKLIWLILKYVAPPGT